LSAQLLGVGLVSLRSAESLCLSATIARINNGALAEGPRYVINNVGRRQSSIITLTAYCNVKSCDTEHL